MLCLLLATALVSAKYDAYIRTVEARPFTWQWPEPVHGGTIDLGGALIHDWAGSTFIPGVTLHQTVDFLQDYPSHMNYYGPEVVQTRLVRHDVNDWVIHYRLVKHYIITVILDVDQTVHYNPISGTRLTSRSEATRITEVRARPGHDHGFLWRLNTYWRLEEKDGGVYVECRMVSLTRSPPYGLGWLINPIIGTLPRESLSRLLTATRTAVLNR